MSPFLCFVLNLRKPDMTLFLNAQQRASFGVSVVPPPILSVCHLSESILSGSIAATSLPTKKGWVMVPLAAFWPPSFGKPGNERSADRTWDVGHFAPPPSFGPPYPPYWAVPSISWMNHIGAGLLARRRIALLCRCSGPSNASCMLTHPPKPDALHQQWTIQTFSAAAQSEKKLHSRNSTAMHETACPKLLPGENACNKKVADLRRCLKRGWLHVLRRALKPKCLQPTFSWLSLCWIGKGCDTFSWPECTLHGHNA